MSTAEKTRDPRPRLRTLWANPQIRYPILMIAYLAVGGSLYSLGFSRFPEAAPELVQITSLIVHKFIGLFTVLTTHRDASVSLSDSACVLAFPAPLRAKLWGVPLGCAAIFGFNVLRITTLLVVGRYQNDYFDFFHVYFWQATLIAMIVSVLYAWIKLFVHR